MAPIHSAVTRRHFLKAFGVATVALALPAPVTPAPSLWPVTVRPPSNGWFEVCPLQVGDVVEIEGFYEIDSVTRRPTSRLQSFVLTEAGGSTVLLH